MEERSFKNRRNILRDGASKQEDRFQSTEDCRDVGKSPTAATSNQTSKQKTEPNKGITPAYSKADKAHQSMRSVFKVLLKPTGNQSDLLHATMRRFAEACNEIGRWATEHEEFSQSGLQKAIYLDIRKEFSLGAQVTVLAIKRVIDTYHVLHYLPDFTQINTMMHDRRTCRFIDDGVVSLWTLQGRRVIPYELRWSSETPPLVLSHGSHLTFDQMSEEQASLVPLIYEEVELCDIEGEFLLNLLYNRALIDHAHASKLRARWLDASDLPENSRTGMIHARSKTKPT